MQGGAGRRTGLSARRARRTKSRGYSRPRQTMADQSILKSAVLPASPMPLFVYILHILFWSFFYGLCQCFCTFVILSYLLLFSFSVFLYFWMLCDAAPLTSLPYPRNPLIPKHIVTFLSNAKITSHFAHFEHVVTKHIATFLSSTKIASKFTKIELFCSRPQF